MDIVAPSDRKSKPTRQPPAPTTPDLPGEITAIIRDDSSRQYAGRGRYRGYSHFVRHLESACDRLGITGSERDAVRQAARFQFARRNGLFAAGEGRLAC